MARQGLAPAQDGQPSGKAVRFFIDAEKRLVHVKFGKKVGARDICFYAEHLKMSPAFEPTFSEIVDLRGAEELDLHPDEFLKLADEVDPFSMNARRAFVVGNPVQSHAARMHKILRTQRNIEIFETVEAAEQWIRS